MRYFTIRKQTLFPSYTISVKEQEKLDRYLLVLEKSNVAEVLSSVKSDPIFLKGRPQLNRYDMFATILYGFAFGSCSLRDLESSCRNDLRYIYLMQGVVPTHAAFGQYINEFILPHTNILFKAVTTAILKECGIEPDVVFVDGTKIEANANKYKFVWKPTKYHERLCGKVRSLLLSHGLDRGIPKVGVFPSLLIAEKLTKFAEIVSGSSEEDKKKHEQQYLQLQAYLEKSLEYEEEERICGPNRNSYYKTDHDATAMTLKTDYYSGLASNMHAAYNVQIAVTKGFACAFYASQSRTDFSGFIPLLENYHFIFNAYPRAVCADSGYGNLENYRFLSEKSIENYVKHQSWEGNVSGRNPERYTLNEDGTIICLNGYQGKIVELKDRHPKKAGSIFYKIDGCNQCSFSIYCKRWQKQKDDNYKIFEVDPELRRFIQQAEANLLSPNGIVMRVNRSAQVEGSFGVLKQNMDYTRFRRRSLSKIQMEYMLTFLGYNIRKLYRFFDNNLKTDYWKAPEHLLSEQRKKPSAKRLANKINKTSSLSANESARDSYKNKYRV